MNIRKIVLSVCLFFFVFSVPAVQAMEFLEGETVTVSEGQVIDGSLFTAGESIRIDGVVQGDVYCGGKEIVITGTIDGDVLCAGQTILIEGTVNGDIRAAGQIIDISGKIGGNITSAGQTTTLQKTASISGELLSLGQNVRIRGYVQRNITAWAEDVDVEGTVQKNIDLHANAVTFTKDARVGGNFSYRSPRPVILDPSATISGTTTYTPLQQETTRKNTQRTMSPQRWNGGAYIVVSLLIGGVLLFMFREKTILHTEALQSQWLSTFGWGVTGLLIAPILLVLFAITLIGIPIAVLGMFLFVLVYFVGRVIVALFVGKMIAERLLESRNSSSWWLGIGVITTWAVFSLPFLGSIISFIASVFSIGAGMLFFFPKRNAKSKGKVHER